MEQRVNKLIILSASVEWTHDLDPLKSMFSVDFESYFNLFNTSYRYGLIAKDRLRNKY